MELFDLITRGNGKWSKSEFYRTIKAAGYTYDRSRRVWKRHLYMSCYSYLKIQKGGGA